eukprot:4532460-Amphidinium_carterae.1
MTLEGREQARMHREKGKCHHLTEISSRFLQQKTKAAEMTQNLFLANLAAVWRGLQAQYRASVLHNIDGGES